MCVAAPAALAIASFAVTTVQTYMQYQGQKAQADWQNRQNEEARKRIQLEYDRRISDGERMRREQYEEDASEVNAYQQQAQRERASLEALLGEYGGGNTGDRKLAAIGIQQGQDLATVRSNATKKQAELGYQESSDLWNISNQVHSLTPAVRPSALGAGLTIAGAGLQLGSRLHDIKNPKPGAGTR